MQKNAKRNALYCPVDGQEMVRQEHGVGHYHACMNCRGLWVPRTYLLALKQKAARELKRKRENAPELLEPVRHAIALNCPECTGPLLARLQEEVPIDVCGFCRAVWLDGDELLRIAGAKTEREKELAEVRARQNASRNPIFPDDSHAEIRDSTDWAYLLGDLAGLLLSAISKLKV